MDKLKQSNVLEVNRLKRNMSSEHDRLVAELNAQIRQLSLEREEASAQVSKISDYVWHIIAYMGARDLLDI